MNRFFVNQLVIAVLVVVVVFTSCTKDEDDKGVVKLLETMTRDGGYIKFEYDSQNRFTKISEYANGATIPVYTETFTYNGNVLVQIERVSDRGYFELEGYSYFIGKNNIIYTVNVTKIRQWGDNQEETESFILDLNSDGYLTKASCSDYEAIYQYSEGNLTKVTWNGETEELKYDSKNSPILHCKTPKWYLIWMGNDFLGLQNNIENFGGYSYIYEFDSNNYPTKMTAKYTYESEEEEVGVYGFKYK